MCLLSFCFFFNFLVACCSLRKKKTTILFNIYFHFFFLLGMILAPRRRSMSDKRFEQQLMLLVNDFWLMTIQKFMNEHLKFEFLNQISHSNFDWTFFIIHLFSFFARTNAWKSENSMNVFCSIFMFDYYPFPLLNSEKFCD